MNDALSKEVREALATVDFYFNDGAKGTGWPEVRAELLRLSDECATLKAQSIYPRAQLLGNLADANERAEKAEAELAAIKSRLQSAIPTTPEWEGMEGGLDFNLTSEQDKTLVGRRVLLVKVDD